jgi:DNA-binding MarR family transcriptional regulator
MTGSTTAAPDTTAPALPAQLADVLARMGRGLRYRTRAAREALDITHSESDLLRLLARKPGIRVHDAATELGIASNSVSTLVKQLSRSGLLTRCADPLDGRVAQLRLTSEAEAWVKQVGNAREEALARALDSLDPEDQERLQRAIPAMLHLSKALARKEMAAAAQ